MHPRSQIVLGLATAAGLLSAGLAAASAAPAPIAGLDLSRSVVFLPMATQHRPAPAPSPRISGEATVGLLSEPDTLYIYGGSALSAAQVQDVLYDGPIDSARYDYQPSAVQRVPRLGDGSGDAVLARVTVGPGEPFVDPVSGEVVTTDAPVTDMPQLTVRFRLVNGLTWEDGVPVSAADSVLSQRLACDPDTPTNKYVCERTVHYVALDERTVEWKGLPGFAEPTYFTYFYTPLPRHQEGDDGAILASASAADVLTNKAFTHEPYSFGPFRIMRWRIGQFIRVERNPYYWRAAEGLPRLDALEFRFVQDEDALVAGLASGDIDVMGRSVLPRSAMDRLAAADAAGAVRLYPVPMPIWEHIDFNVDPLDDRRPPFGACKAFRQAVAFGTDRSAMADLLNRGATPVLDGVAPPDHWAAPSTLPGTIQRYGYDPDRARALLESLGLIDGDGDGIREAGRNIACPTVVDGKGTVREHRIAAGTPVELTLNTTDGNKLREDIALLFQANMKDIGIEVSLEFLAASHLFQDGPDGPIFGRSFDLALFGWRTDYTLPVELYLCDEVPGPENAWAGQNDTGWCDPAYDRAAHAHRTALDRAAARAAAFEAQRIMADHLPMLPLMQRPNIAATRAGLAGFIPDATVKADTWNSELWGWEGGG